MVRRACFVFEIRPGAEVEYRRRHDDIWPEAVAAIRRAGLRNYSLFRRGNQIIAYVEADDIAASFAELGGTDVAARWGEHMSDLIVSLADEHGQLRWADEVWHLD